MFFQSPLAGRVFRMHLTRRLDKAIHSSES